jgi:AcrR family transcriptional regulator
MSSRSTRRRPAREGDASRARLVAAAAAEFAARGFAGASVDRIARAARLNKAMIYYHFDSKAGLYGEILRDMFGAVAVRVRAAADSSATPDEKLRQFVAAIALEAEARPHFPPIWLREVAEGGAHLDAGVVQLVGSIVQMLAGIIDEGVRSGRFVSTNPFVVHASIVGPVLLFFASDRLRTRVARMGVSGMGTVDRDLVVAHVQRLALATVEGRV